MSQFLVKPLSLATWQDFAALVERHNGVWGGCWCLGFHPEGKEPGPHRQEQKHCRVTEGTAHAALVFADDTCVGWCQFGSPQELTRIKHLREYREKISTLPQWRVTCFFVDKAYRGKGVSSVALGGAIEEISRLGGGTVESYPEDASGRKISGSFLYNSNISIFEHHGFQRVHRLGKNHWVMSKFVPSAASEA
jgi:GNAT superfamily N-acetyltransferase